MKFAISLFITDSIIQINLFKIIFTISIPFLLALIYKFLVINRNLTKIFIINVQVLVYFYSGSLLLIVIFLKINLVRSFIILRIKFNSTKLRFIRQTKLSFNYFKD